MKFCNLLEQFRIRELGPKACPFNIIISFGVDWSDSLSPADKIKIMAVRKKLSSCLADKGEQIPFAPFVGGVEGGMFCTKYKLIHIFTYLPPTVAYETLFIHLLDFAGQTSGFMDKFHTTPLNWADLVSMSGARYGRFADGYAVASLGEDCEALSAQRKPLSYYEALLGEDCSGLSSNHGERRS